MPVVLFTKGGGLWLDVQADSAADALGLDWTMPLDRARQVLTESQRDLTKRHKTLQGSKAIQGNLDRSSHSIWFSRDHSQRGQADARWRLCRW